MRCAPDPVEVFRETAESCCQVIDHVHEHGAEDLIGRMLSLLPRLLLGAAELPALEPRTDVEAWDTGHDAWSERFAAINDVLGTEAYGYWTTIAVQAAPEPPEVVYWWVADDLADIWRGPERRLADPCFGRAYGRCGVGVALHVHESLGCPCDRGHPSPARGAS